MRSRLRLASAALVASAFVAAQTGAEQAVLPQGDALAYSRPSVGVMVAAQGAENRVVYNQGPDVAPRFSPDKRQVLFHSVEGGTPGVWLADVPAGEKQRVCDGEQPAWSPDGARIAFIREGRLMERQVATGNETVVSPEDAPPLAFPSYVAGGTWLCVDKGGRRMFRIASDASPAIELLAEGELRSAPRCSPDGRTVAYQDGAHIYLLNLETRERTQLTRDPGVQSWPVWGEDGRSLCYFRALSPLAAVGDICHLQLDRPEAVGRVARRVHPAFDWRGVSPSVTSTVVVPGGALNVWRGNVPLHFSETMQVLALEGWERLPQGVPESGFAGDVGVENDWLVLVITREQLAIVSKGTQGNCSPLVLHFITANGADAGTISDVRLVRNTADEAILRVSFAGGGSLSTASIRVPRTRPCVECAPVEGIKDLVLEAPAELIVIPDRFSNDVVVSETQMRPNEPAALPQAPVLLALLPHSGAMLAVVAASEAQSVSLNKGAEGTGIGEMTIDLSGEQATIALLDSQPLWQRLDLAHNAETGRWSARSARPFYAEWRMSVCDARTSYSRMWNADELARLGNVPMPVDATFVGDPGVAALYVWGRDENTPLDVLTPSDVLLDVLGLDGYMKLLDIEGICGYRTGEPPVPFRELSTRNTSWHPAKANDEEGEFGVLEVLGSVFPAATPGTQSLVAHLGGDALNLLRGLDVRIDEYQEFLGDIAAFSEAHEDADPSGWLTEVKSEVRETLESGKAATMTDVAEATKALNDLAAILGTRDFLTLDVMRVFCKLPGNEDWAEVFEDFLGFLGAKEGRMWHGGVLCHEIWYEHEFKTFSELCRRLLAERESVLGAYRERVKGVRDAAACRVIRDPAFKAVGDELRRLTQRVLRNRCYLENDWRGETPVENGERP